MAGKSLPSNIDLHLFRTREGYWCVRVDGLPQPFTTKGMHGEPGLDTPTIALEVAAEFIESHDPILKATRTIETSKLAYELGFEVDWNC